MTPSVTSRKTHARRFIIHGNDPRTRITRPAPNPQRPRPNRQEALHKLRTALESASNSSLAEGTKVTNKSQWAYWEEFCTLFEVNMEDFGKLQGDQSAPSLDLVRKEEETLAAFMAFVVACSRKGKTNNSANYALQCISTVRSHYALRSGRRPGLRANNKTGGQLQSIIRGFQKTHPSRRESRIPLLQQHLRAIRNQLDLQTNRYHKVLWALWLTQWQGVLRSSDLIKKARDGAKPWNPNRDTHRVRLSVDKATNLEGQVIGARLKLRLKPNKTDQAGQKGTTKTFVVDQNPEALSAGRASREMLRTDANDDGLQNTPLFRHPESGKEITYEESKAALTRLLRAAGYSEPAGTHSLRIGGATAYANASEGGYAVSGFMGLWASDSRDWYMHACTPRIDMAALEIGRASNWALAERPGPVSRYAS